MLPLTEPQWTQPTKMRPWWATPVANQLPLDPEMALALQAEQAPTSPWTMRTKPEALACVVPPAWGLVVAALADLHTGRPLWALDHLPLGKHPPLSPTAKDEHPQILQWIEHQWPEGKFLYFFQQIASSKFFDVMLRPGFTGPPLSNLRLKYDSYVN